MVDEQTWRISKKSFMAEVINDVIFWTVIKLQQYLSFVHLVQICYELAITLFCVSCV